MQRVPGSNPAVIREETQYMSARAAVATPSILCSVPHRTLPLSLACWPVEILLSRVTVVKCIVGCNPHSQSMSGLDHTLHLWWWDMESRTCRRLLPS